MTEKILHRTQPAFIYGAMASVIVLVVLGSYLYLFRDAMAEYALLQETRTMLQETVASGAQLTSAISHSQQQIETLRQRLEGESPRLPVNQMIAHTIDRLDRIAAQHEIQLISVSPDKPKAVTSFEELPFSVEVIGKYQHLASWLGTVEKNLAPMVVKHFEIIPLTGEELLTLRMEMVSYRLPENVL